MAPGQKQPSTILIVDDDPSALLVSTKPLRDAGYTVLQAPGSAEALKLYAEHPEPDPPRDRRCLSASTGLSTFRRQEPLSPRERSRHG
jgi:CheY-like chemotaxis protein